MWRFRGLYSDRRATAGSTREALRAVRRFARGRGAGQHRQCPHEAGEVQGPHEEHAGEDPESQGRQAGPKEEAQDDPGHPLPQDHENHGPIFGTHGFPDPDLPDPAAHRVADDPVQFHGGQHQGQAPTHTDEPGSRPSRGALPGNERWGFTSLELHFSRNGHGRSGTMAWGHFQKTREGMPDPSETRKTLKVLCKRYAVADLYVFGSRAAEIATRVKKGAASGGGDFAGDASGDVDIGVRPRPGIHLSVRKIADLTRDLEDLFGTERVDLVLLPAATPFLALDVVRGELLYCLDPDEQAEHELYILRRAGDLAPFQRQREELVLSRWRDA